MSKQESPKTGIPHQWVYNGLSTHNGEYWYECKKCKKAYWVAHDDGIETVDINNCPVVNDV